MPRKFLPGLFAIALLLLLGAVLSPRSTAAQFPPGTVPGGPPPFPGQTPFPGAPTIDPFITPTVTPTPTPPLTPAPTSAAPGCSAPFPAQAGSIVTIRSGVSIRSEPSVSAPLLQVFQEPRNFTVIDGPICNENYFWWQIQGHRVIGWVAQANNVQPFITAIRAPGEPCAAALPLVAGQLVELGYAVRVRAEPSLRGLVLTVAPFAGVVRILSTEPVCAEGYNWRLVEVTVVGIVYQGWLAEGTAGLPSEAFVVQPTQDPLQVCLPPLRLEIGTLGRVRYRDGTPKNLRAAPSQEAEVLYTLVENVPFEIVGGPICSRGMNYWQVRVLGTIQPIGWIAEGGRGNYWIGPFD